MADKYLDPVSGKEIEYQTTCHAISDALEEGRISVEAAAEMTLRCLGDKPSEDTRGSADEWVTLTGKLLIIGGPKLLEAVGKIITLIKLFA
jgi:hypothetical protein